MPLTPAEEEELEQNGMTAGFVGRFYYDEMRRQGLTHRQALRNFIDGLNNMQSNSLTADQLQILKGIIGRIKGQMF